MALTEDITHLAGYSVRTYGYQSNSNCSSTGPHLEPVLKADGPREHQCSVLAQRQPRGGAAAVHGAGVLRAQALHSGQASHEEGRLQGQAI